MKPRYQHDCDACEFIRELKIDDTTYDVYRCGVRGHVSWIARFGDDGPEYWSMPWSILKYVDTAGDVTPLLVAMQHIAKKWETK